jgi:hypothetical protein
MQGISCWVKACACAFMASWGGSPALGGDYTAVLSCGMGQHINILACFKDTELRIQTENESVVYKIYNLHQAGVEYSDGLHIELPSRFVISAMNSHKLLILTLTVWDDDGIVSSDQAGQYGIVSARK